ncbi:MAG: ImmA/IrrE family metallo-endopeptidase [Proteobacteria bacterium]|nr:ImmA/IrrE family metallo-endopeptidase [Pseudomonadota bacterium]
MRSGRANISKPVLRWARVQAGYSQEDARRKLQVKIERYQAWENDNEDLKPTIKQLRKIAKLYKRPVSLFYLTDPPQGFQPMRDFRRLPGDGLLSYSPALLYSIELAQQRRNLALELYQDVGEEIGEFVMRASLEDEPEALGARIRRDLGITFSDQVQWRRYDALGPFKAWRRALEDLNILVFQMGSVDREEISGFALAENYLPIVAVNRKDVPNRRTFSLLHEFVHILLKLSGASDLDVDARRPPEEQRVEIFCNRVAAAALMPSEQVLGLASVQAHAGHSTDWHDAEIREASDIFGVSREAFVRRLLTLGRTTRAFYEAKRKQYRAEFLDNLEKRQKQYRESEKKFRKNPPQDVFVELGRPYVRLVLDGVRHDLLTLNEASGYLGNLRIRHFPKLEQRAYTG